MFKRNEWPIDNAGQVLAQSFLPRMFSVLGLLIGSRFADSVAAERAVYLLQFMVYGESRERDSGLALSKVLCGIDANGKLSPHIELTEHERDTVKQMLHGMLMHWPSMDSTSPETFREVFLLREGLLSQEEDGWHLRVQARSYDLLLDRLSWSVGPIHYPWMDKPLRVAWRNA
ncbi:contractile injection system tape measure protein [Pseudothauera rhizosphaerae]|uniref:Uncharacterized protein n=1 Tax=Pseudothauera rhizosphaerae TaxID=2565932 RepID=A0A4S4AFX8_9RHOO|nr:contractile injection system tape measure protein [Pseudothauera rhizosphaerae]THF58113.1 hypothetical protein E6O51_17385 [Pseudothauera rhizosphaerae]